MEFMAYVSTGQGSKLLESLINMPRSTNLIKSKSSSNKYVQIAMVSQGKYFLYGNTYYI